MDGDKDYVTRRECEERREAINKENDARDKMLTTHETKMNFLEKAFWTIFATLVTGFAGVIFAVLSLAR